MLTDRQINRLLDTLEEMIELINIQSIMIKAMLDVLQQNELVNQKDWFALLNYYGEGQ